MNTTYVILGAIDASVPHTIPATGVGTVMHMSDRAITRPAMPHPGTTVSTANTDKTALENFLAGHEKRAFHVAQAALWDREAALDVVQDSMLRLVEHYRDKSPAEWPALFFTILNNRINDVRRKRMIEQGRFKLLSLTGLFRHREDAENADVEHELPAAERSDGITGPETGRLSDELKNHVDKALQSLSERQRQVFILREWRGMSINETATILGCSENSIKQHHFRALRELRKQLAEVWDHEQPSTP